MRIQRKESKGAPEGPLIRVVGKNVRSGRSTKAVESLRTGRLAKGSRPGLGRSQRAKTVSSLSLASQLTKEASRLGFDWPNLDGVLKKLEEEMREFKEALTLKNRSRIREELGDLLFALVNISRFLRIDPDEALRKTVQKFVFRFEYIETSLRKKGKDIYQSNLMEMDQLWEEAKKREK